MSKNTQFGADVDIYMIKFCLNDSEYNYTKRAFTG